ncbi:MAG: mechanosensitive ion channel family protein [Prevotellaceae bacterium]|jgi:small-conductance mechanosensitive channel|nr:mechanosensitive ion channel family protein [Prevotellaceae bacterium]
MDASLIKIIISVSLIFLVYPIIRFVLYKVIDRVASFNLYDTAQAKMIKKTFNWLTVFVLLTILISIWGVDAKNLMLALSSVFAVIGVALFAQWSIISNVTAGIVIFFSLQLRIGDRIKIHDKDIPSEAIVKDLKLFYIHLETDEGEKIAYPNNLLLQKGISIYRR